MSLFTIKILAMLFMLIDHIGYAIGYAGFAANDVGFLYVACRAIGRLAMPLFCFTIANGFKYTKNVKKYALRLFAFAVLSEVPFDLLVSKKVTIIDYSGRIPNLSLDNVFFTLLLGLLFLCTVDWYKKRNYKCKTLFAIFAFGFFAAFAGFISADYGVIGVGFVAAFSLYFNSEKKINPALILSVAVVSSWRLIARTIVVVVYRLTSVHIGKIPLLAYFLAGKFTITSMLQVISVLSLVFVFMYNQKSGLPENKTARTVAKYAMYAFYPIHLLLLYFIF